MGNEHLYDACYGGCGKKVFNRSGYCVKCRPRKTCVDCGHAFVHQSLFRSRCDVHYRLYLKHGEMPTGSRDQHTKEVY